MKGLRFMVEGLWTFVEGLWLRVYGLWPRLAMLIVNCSLLISFISCQDELCYNHNHAVPVRLHFTFSPAPEQNPKQMNVYFFPSTGDAPLMYQTSGSGVETVMLPIGKYRVMCLNSDTETIEYHNTDTWDGFYVTARRESVPENARSGTEEVLMQPENLFVATLAADTALVDIENGYDLGFATENVVYNYNFTIEGVKNLQYVSSMTGYISGLASGYYVCNKAPYTNPCTHGFDATYDAEQGEVYISMTTFGKIEYEVSETAGVPSNLTLDVTLTDGSIWEYDIDVTRQLDEAEPDENLHIDILIEDIPIPEPVNPGNSTFNPEVDGWGEGEDIPVPM